MHMYAFAWHICLWQVTILTALDYNFVKVDLIISYYLVFESYFYDKKKTIFSSIRYFWMAHTHMTPSVPQYSSHTGWRWEENTSRNRMKLLMNYALGFCFNLLREFFLSTHHMLYILSNGFNRKRTEDHKGQYKHENSISKHLLLKKKKITGRWEYL